MKPPKSLKPPSQPKPLDAVALAAPCLATLAVMALAALARAADAAAAAAAVLEAGLASEMDAPGTVVAVTPIARRSWSAGTTGATK